MQSGYASAKSPTDLYRIAKKAGVWDPESIPVAEDAHDWQALNAGEREQLLKICALFYEGEVSVSETLAWWLVAIPEDDRKVFLASQIFEEVKHAEFFALCFKNVFGNVDTRAYLNPAYQWCAGRRVACPRRGHRPGCARLPRLRGRNGLGQRARRR